MAINCHFWVVDGWEKVYNRYFGCRIWFCTQKYPPTRRLGSYAVNLRKWPKSQKCQKLLYLANLMCLMPGKVYITIIWDAEFDLHAEIPSEASIGVLCWKFVKMVKIQQMWINAIHIGRLVIGCSLEYKSRLPWEWARTQYMRCAQASWVRA